MMNLAAHDAEGAMPLGKFVTAPHVAPAPRRNVCQDVCLTEARSVGLPRSLKYAMVVVELATASESGLPLQVKLAVNWDADGFAAVRGVRGVRRASVPRKSGHDDEEKPKAWLSCSVVTQVSQQHDDARMTRRPYAPRVSQCRAGCSTRMRSLRAGPGRS